MKNENILEALKDLTALVESGAIVKTESPTPDKVHRKLKSMSGELDLISKRMDENEKAMPKAMLEATYDATYVAVSKASADEIPNYQEILKNSDAIKSLDADAEIVKSYSMQIPDFNLDRAQHDIIHRANAAINTIFKITDDNEFWWKVSNGPAYTLVKNLIAKVCGMFSVEELDEITSDMIERRFVVENFYTMMTTDLWELEMIADTLNNKLGEYDRVPLKMYWCGESPYDDTPSTEFGDNEVGVTEPAADPIDPEDDEHSKLVAWNTWEAADNTETSDTAEESAEDSSEDTAVVEETTVEETTETVPARVLSEEDAAKVTKVKASIDAATRVFNSGLGTTEDLETIFEMEKIIDTETIPKIAMLYDAKYAEAFNQFAAQGKIEKLPAIFYEL